MVDIEAIRKKYSHYPETLNKNTAVFHIRELLKEIDRLKLDKAANKQ